MTALARLEDGIGARTSSPESVLRDHPVATLARPILFAMDDRFDEARTLAAAAMDVLRERGDTALHTSYIIALAEIEMLAGNYEPAEEHLLLAYDFGLARGAADVCCFHRGCTCPCSLRARPLRRSRAARE